MLSRKLDKPAYGESISKFGGACRISDFFLGDPGNGAGVGPAFDESEEVKDAVWFPCHGHALGLTVNRGLAWSCGKTSDH